MMPQGVAEDIAALSDSLRRYYREPAVQERLGEFLGCRGSGRMSAAYVTATDGNLRYCTPRPPSLLGLYLNRGLEVDRSLWDHDSLIADIDLEYHSFDVPAAAWLTPERAFRLQQPVLDATLRILRAAGIAPLVLLSGRGYHLVWSVNRKSHAFERLAEIGHVPATLQARYDRPHSPVRSRIDPVLGRAFAGLGLIIEFIAHRVLQDCAHTCAVPLQPTAIEVGPGIQGREIVSFDLSEYGDPLHTRHIRIPFSAYLKPRQFEWLLGEAAVESLLPIFEIPLDGMSISQAIAASRDPRAVRELARSCSVEIPDAPEAMEQLLNLYQSSALADFHQWFHAQLRSRAWFSADPASIRMPQEVPPCLSWPLEHPNNWLLKPAVLQHVARMLTAFEWSPAAIAQLIWASYRKECEWGRTWRKLEPCQRAIFYTRLFTGLIATGTDKLIDMNCVSHQEKGFCGVGECHSNLEEVRRRLVEKRSA